MNRSLSLETIAKVPAEQVPAAVLLLASVLSELSARLAMVPPPAPTPPAPPPAEIPTLTAEQIAERLGVSTDYVYRHQRQLGGVKLSRRVLRFPDRS